MSIQSLRVSEVQIFPVKPKDGLVAFASCVINEALYLGNIAVYTKLLKPGHYRLVFPSKKLSGGKEIICVHPINKEVGNIITNAIVLRFEKVMKEYINENP